MSYSCDHGESYERWSKWNGAGVDMNDRTGIQVGRTPLFKTSTVYQNNSWRHEDYERSVIKILQLDRKRVRLQYDRMDYVGSEDSYIFAPLVGSV